MLYTIMIIITFVVLTYFEDGIWFKNETIPNDYTRSDMLMIKTAVSFFWPITLSYYVFNLLEQVLPRSK